MLKKSEFEPSTKMMRMIELILRWKTEAPEDRVIIYSQCMLLLFVMGLNQFVDITSSGTSMLNCALFLATLARNNADRDTI